MKYYFFILSLFPISVLSQIDTIKIENEYWGNKNMKSQKVYTELYQYNYTIWYKNGQKKSEGSVKSEKKWGEWTEWYENGQVKAKYEYEEWTGKFTSSTSYKFSFHSSWDSLGNRLGQNGTGWYEVYDDSNHLSHKAYYINSIQDSLSISYYQNGQPEIIDKYDNGNWTHRTIYHDNGNKAYEFSRKFGYKKHGISRTWYYSGQLKMEENYEEGVLVGKLEFHRNGVKKSEAKCRQEYDSTEGAIYEVCDSEYWDEKGNKIEK